MENEGTFVPRSDCAALESPLTLGVPSCLGGRAWLSVPGRLKGNTHFAILAGELNCILKGLSTKDKSRFLEDAKNRILLRGFKR